MSARQGGRASMDASVIIPAHRAEATLPETLRSVEAARAAFPGESEIVVVDDPDGRGPSWARNRGLDRARGEYVFFCDADDLARPDFLSRPVAALAESGAAANTVSVIKTESNRLRVFFKCFINCLRQIHDR